MSTINLPFIQGVPKKSGMCMNSYVFVEVSWILIATDTTNFDYEKLTFPVITSKRHESV